MDIQMNTNGPSSIQIAESRTILRCIAGSESTGTSVGTGDRDELGVFIEPIGRAVGFSTLEQVVYRTAASRTGKHDEPSQPGDLDLTLYTLRKFLQLCLKGNPTIISLLFAPEEQCIVKSKEGLELQSLAPHIICKGTAGAFLGYLKAQRERLLGERGGKDVNRPDLVKEYGYDTKYAAHTIRLGYQGWELMTWGKITLPMPEHQREDILKIRKGGKALSYVVEQSEMLESEIIKARDSSSLPKDPNRDFVEKWMLAAYLRHWEADRITKVEAFTPLPLTPQNATYTAGPPLN